MTKTVVALGDKGDPGFKSELNVQLTTGLWVVKSPLVWQGSEGDAIVVSIGEETDFASVPRLLQALLPSADSRVVRASVVHDFLCRELNDYYRGMEEWLAGLDLVKITGDEKFRRPRPERPAFSAVDADAIFEKIMRDEGAGWWMRNTGWLGVRLGALWNPARRAGWLRTLPRVAVLSTLFLAVALAGLAIVGMLTVLSGLVGPFTS